MASGEEETIMPSQICALIFVGLLLSAASPAVRAATPAGSVVAIAGRCSDQSAGQRRTLKMGDLVYVRDRIEVPAGAKLKLRMKDGSVLSLGSASRLTIRAYRLGPSGQRQNATLSMALGVMRAVVSKVDHPSVFEVESAVGTAGVRSTDWFIIVTPGAERVGVLSGSVVLKSSATHRSEIIPARWGARLEAGRDPVPARLWTASEFDDVIRRTTVP